MRILLISDLRGAIKNLATLNEQRRKIPCEAVCFCGNIVRGQARLEEWTAAKAESRVPNRNRREIIAEAYEDLQYYKQFCSLMDALGLPVLIIPGQLDAPEERYFMFMQQSVFISRHLYLVQENIIHLDSYLFTGFGGLLTEHEREDYFVQHYSRDESLFGTRRMRYLNPPRILLFHSSPVFPENGAPGCSPIVNELIQAAAPSLLFCGSATAAPRIAEIGGTVVVNPGSLAEGHYALVNTKTRAAEFYTLSQGRR